MQTQNEQTETVPVQPIVRWIVSQRDLSGRPTECKLIVGKLLRRRKQRCVATVWVDRPGKSATWHTWDASGTGLQNDVAYGYDWSIAMERAKADATLAAVEQRLI